MAHEHSLDDARARAALYALGALRGDDAQEFERHMQAGCTVCTTEVDAFAAVATDLGRTATPLAPGSSVRVRVLERVAAESAFVEQGVFHKDGLRFVRSASLPWTEGRTPAVEVKTLFVDQGRGFVTKLVRMPPGSTLLPHRHADVEESFVLEGDLLVSGVPMGPGDYCRAEPGSTHTGVVTRGGCVFIAVSSQHDQPLA